MSSTGQNVTDDHANFKKKKNLKTYNFFNFISTFSLYPMYVIITWTWRYVGIDTDDATIWYSLDILRND
jgi:hypothetical protein